MHINHTIRARRQTALHQLVVRRKPGGIQCSTEHSIHQVLPAHRQSEHVQAVVVHKVLHLSDTVGVSLREEWRGDAAACEDACRVAAAEIETG